MQNWVQHADRYLAINAWLKRRYSKDGWLTLSVGAIPSRYTILDIAFFKRYVAIE